MKITKDKELLRKKSEEVMSNEVDFLKGRLNSIISQYNGHIQGCAAIQIRIPKNYFVIRNPRTLEFTHVVNPKVLFKFGIRLSYEGCLSVENRHYCVRPMFVLVRYYDSNKYKEVTRLLGWKMTRIFMHEYDHLNGKFIGDKS